VSWGAVDELGRTQTRGGGAVKWLMVVEVGEVIVVMVDVAVDDRDIGRDIATEG
jgi:hypothetical protein